LKDILPAIYLYQRGENDQPRGQASEKKINRNLPFPYVQVGINQVIVSCNCGFQHSQTLKFNLKKYILILFKKRKSKSVVFHLLHFNDFAAIENGDSSMNRYTGFIAKTR